MPAPELALQARYVFPVSGPPIAEGMVRLRGERISYVGTADRQPDRRYERAAILPGLVNSHTHLELSGLRARDLGPTDFCTWLRRLIEASQKLAGAELAHAAQRGIDALLAAGTTLVGEVSSTRGQSWRPLARSPLRAVVFRELIGLRRDRAWNSSQAARRWLEQIGFGAADEPAAAAELPPLPARPPQATFRRLTPALSPHAPYSTHPALYRQAAAWAAASLAPLCTHLAETAEERQLLAERTGPLFQLLQALGAWDPAWQPLATNPAGYVDTPPMSNAQWLVAHGNYLAESEFAGWSARPGRAVAFCPRSHDFFGHRQHPYRAMLAAGLTVCLGTDSLASAPSLSVLDELRYLHRRDQSLSGRQLLHMATLAGAKALGREHQCGSLEPGKQADLAIVRLPDREEPDPHLLLLESDQPVLQTLIAGRVVFQRR